MELIALVVGTMLFIVVAVVAIAALVTLGAVFVRAFRRPLGRWLEWVDDSFSGGRR